MPVMTRHTFPKDLRPGIDAHIGLSRQKVKPVYPMIFKSRKTNKAWEEIVHMSGLGSARVKAEGAPVDLDEMGQGWSTFIRVQNFGLGFAMTQEVIEDNLYHDLVGTGSRELVQSFAYAKEIVHASHFNYAFNTNYRGGDGQPLASLVHPSVHPQAAPYRNTLTVQADLSETSIEQAVIDISRLKNERGIPVNIEARALVIPTDLMFEETRILRNKMRPGTTDHDISALNMKGILQREAIVWKYLTSQKMWTILTDVNDDEGFVTLDRVKFSPKHWGDDRTGNYFVTARERYGSGYLNPRCCFIVDPT